jgi:hypothetical protein
MKASVIQYKVSTILFKKSVANISIGLLWELVCSSYAFWIPLYYK